MNLSLKELYQQIILDHARAPRNQYPLTDPDARHAHGRNPLCGDRVTVHLTTDNRTITDIAFESEGCAISTASASLMTSKLKGESIDEARRTLERFQNLVTGREQPGDDPDDIEMLAGVSRFPTRVKCATLPWHTFRAALTDKHPEDRQSPVTTEI